MRFSSRYLIFLFLSLCTIVSGQDGKVASLQLQLQKCSNDSQRVQLLNDLSWLLKGSNLDTAIILGKEAVKLSELNKLTGGLTRSEAKLGTLYAMKGDYALSLAHYNKALYIWEKILSSRDTTWRRAATIGKASVLGNLGNVYLEQGNYSKAIDCYFASLKIAEQQGNKKTISKHKHNIGLAYYYTGEYDKALKFLFSALKTNEEMNDKPNIGLASGNIGLTYYEKGDFAKALEYYLLSLASARELNDDFGVTMELTNIGSAYKSLGNYDKALEHLNQAYELSKKLDEKPLIASCLLQTGDLYLSFKKMKEAEKCLLQSLALGKELGSLKLVNGSEKSLTKIYEETGEAKQAFIHYKNFIASHDSLINEENHKKQLRTEMNYEFEKKEAIINEQRQKELAVAEEKSRFQAIIIWSVVFGLALVIVFAFFVFRSLKIARVQKLIIEEKQREILDSIRYARRIQTALMTHENYIERNLNRLDKN